MHCQALYSEQLMLSLEPIPESAEDCQSDASNSTQCSSNCQTPESDKFRLIRNFGMPDLTRLVKLESNLKSSRKARKISRPKKLIDLVMPDKGQCCSICRQSMEGEVSVRVKKCGHLAHRKCHQQWLRLCDTCLPCLNKA